MPAQIIEEICVGPKGGRNEVMLPIQWGVEIFLKGRCHGKIGFDLWDEAAAGG
jgi:hypothetical protein